MKNQYNRLEIMLGHDLEKIQNSCVAIVGIGGVGSFAIETLARCGVKKLIIVDKDVVDITNLNRQLIALHSSIGMKKSQVMKDRIKDINPNCEVIDLIMFVNEDTINKVFDLKPDFVIDACDTIETKFMLIQYCLLNKIKFISSMGAANKMDATLIEVVDLMKTYNDPIAKILRNKIKKAKLNGKIPVAFSRELPKKPDFSGDTSQVISRKELPLLGSNAFVPSTFGIVCANYCFRELLKK